MGTALSRKIAPVIKTHVVTDTQMGSPAAHLDFLELATGNNFKYLSGSMPELPEVENVRLSLQQQGLVGQRFAKVELLRPDLRAPFPSGMSRRLQGQSVCAIKRRAKYLLFETEKLVLLSHLGMTGSWRELDDRQKHDHVILHFSSGRRLAFNDPRRFGLLDLFTKDQVEECAWLRHLGVEPLSDQFTAEYLFAKSRRVKAPIKGFLMDQRRVVGVGNIYASEALFAAGVRPSRLAGKIKREEAHALVENIRGILTAAIAAGGSTISDYRNSKGEAGNFQQGFKVYDRKGQSCVRCRQPVKSKMIAGRNTFWCAKCQR